MLHSWMKEPPFVTYREEQLALALQEAEARAEKAETELKQQTNNNLLIPKKYMQEILDKPENISLQTLQRDTKLTPLKLIRVLAHWSHDRREEIIKLTARVTELTTFLRQAIAVKNMWETYSDMDYDLADTCQEEDLYNKMLAELEKTI